MPKKPFIAACAVLSLSFATAQTAFAADNCRIQIDSGKCVVVEADQRSAPDYTVGEAFPIYEYNMVINVDRYKLPPVDGAWRYYKAGHEIYRVDANNNEVLEIIETASF